MPFTLTLTDGTNTAALNDGTNYKTIPSTFLAPPPRARLSLSGSSFFRDGQDLQAIAYENRPVRVGIQVIGSSDDNLIANVQQVEEMLRRAREFGAKGLGSQVQLKYQWDGATNPVYFNIIHGELDLGPTALSSMLLLNTRIVGAVVNLVCEPFAVGTAETLENYLDDPGFELDDGTAFGDWTVNNGTRSTNATAVQEGAVWGRVTSNTSATQLDITQTKTMVAGNHVFEITYRINGDQSYELHISDAGGTSTTALTADNTVRTASVTRSSGANTSITCGVRQTGATTDTNDTVDLDLAYLGDGTTAPTGWVSSRNVFNAHDDEGKLDQARTNYIDLESIPGDVLAKLQVKATENEAHTHFWCGARHNGRQRDTGIWHEGEGFTGIGETITPGATASSSQVARQRHGIEFDATSNSSTTTATSLTFSHTTGTGGNTIIVVVVAWRDAARTVSSVTYNALALTALTQRDNTVDDHVQIFYRVAPTTGANNVVVTMDSSTNDIIAGATTFNGVNQSSPVGTETSAAANGTDATVAVTTTAGDVVVGGVATDGTGSALTPGSGTTERWETTGGGVRAVGGDEEATGTSTTFNWTIAAAGDYVIAAVPIQPVNAPATAAAPIVITKAITTPPSGLYRVLARVSSVDSNEWGIGIGYAYGGVPLTPSIATHYTTTSTSAFHVVDLGTITVPPIPTPTGQTAPTLTLRVAMYMTTAANRDEVDIDWVMLMPVDQGFAYVSKTSGQDVVLTDSRSPLRSIYLLNTSDVVQSVPANQLGDPPMAHPEGTRIYFVSDNGAADVADGWTVGITYLPRYVHVG